MRAASWIAAGILFAAGGEAVAADRGLPTYPQRWVSTPSKEDRTTAYATIVKPGGYYRAVIRCNVEDDGALSGCQVAQETPAGSGFGATAVGLTYGKYKRRPPSPGEPRQVQIVEDWSSADVGADWLRRPSADEILSVFPTEAFKEGVSGRATISCVVTVQGALTDCVTAAEIPDGMGFGAAAIALTPQLMMRPATERGRPVASGVRIPINFPTRGRGKAFGTMRMLPPNITWMEAPTPAQMAAAYPKKARDEKRGGRVTLACAMTLGGHLRYCEVVSLEPKGYGFETAAKLLAKAFHLEIDAAAERRMPEGMAVQLPFTFDPRSLDQTKPVTGKPTVTAAPDADQVKGEFGPLQLAGTSRATLSCKVQAAGLLADCSVVSEEPIGAGVGAAALKLAPAFRMSTWTSEGLPVLGGTIQIPLRYEPDAPAKP